MRVLMINASPNKDGNTARIMRELEQRVRQKGGVTEWIDLATLKVQDCEGCHQCQRTGACRIQDDMPRVVAELQRADVLVFGTPIYMGAETGRGKCFLDRLYSLSYLDQDGVRKGRLGPGKKVFTLMTCMLGDGDKLYAYLNTNHFRLFINWLGFDFIVSSIVSGCDDRERVLHNYRAQNAIEDALGLMQF